ncbi:MAG: N-(5'-phosphoribosyl)anthranilate isomerase [Acidimicrobiia bacterium]
MSIWVKLCGVRTHRDVEAAAAAGADAMGVVMTPSLRMVDIETARALVLAAPRDLLKVAVFYRPERAHVEAVRDAVSFDLFQAEPETLEGIDGIEVLPVVHDRSDLAPAVARAAKMSGSGRVLVESAGHGGKGAAPDWGRVAAVGNLDHVVVAGGLTPDNVGGVVATLRPGGVDVSSGVESAPGVKDPILMERFVEMARSGAREVV